MDRVSYMIAIPVDEQELQEPETLIERLGTIEGLQLLKAEMEEEAEAMQIEAVYNDTLYLARVYPMEFSLPNFFRAQHLFPEVDIAAIEMRNVGLGVELEFAGDALVSYHLQLKMIDAMFSGLLAVLDDSAEKILSGRWVNLAAASHVPPAPRYLYTVQAVAEDEGEVWLHSHGLNRCGVTELEILGSDHENYQSHYYIIETMANRLLEQEEALEPKKPVFLARLSEKDFLVTTLVPWQEAVALYDEDLLGGVHDREEGHNGDTSCIFAYASHDDCDRGHISPVTIYDEILENNPVYMISNKETERMKALALERMDYLRSAACDENVTILVKLGLPVSDYEAAGTEKEHIWFELLDINERTLRAKLTQEPYYIEGLHEGHVGEYTLDMVTDWMIYTPERRLTPDDVYLLEGMRE